MKIVSSKRINFLVSNIFERYYGAIMEELYCSGLTEELVQNVIQEILMLIYRKAMDEGIETEEELDILAEPVINERLEKVLFLHYAKEYVDRFPIDKVSWGKGVEKEEQKMNENEKVEPEPDKNLHLYNNYEDAEEVEFIDLTSERKEVPVIRRIEEPRIHRFRINWGLTIIASVVVTMTLWFGVGVLMGRGYVPRVDMGYTWFNSHIWSVF